MPLYVCILPMLYYYILCIVYNDIITVRAAHMYLPIIITITIVLVGGGRAVYGITL